MQCFYMAPLLIFLLSLCQLHALTSGESMNAPSYTGLNDLPSDGEDDSRALLPPEVDDLSGIKAGQEDDAEVQFRLPIAAATIDYARDTLVLHFRRPQSKWRQRFGVDVDTDEAEKRRSLANNFMRFGRSSADFMRLGKRQPEEMPTSSSVDRVTVAGSELADDNGGRYERSSDGVRDSRGDNFMRFGRSPDDSGSTRDYIRFGRSPGDFMRFGRDPGDYMRFGRTPKQDYMRFGRDPKQDFMRFGRDTKQDFMRFGRDSKQDFMRFGRDPKEDFMRFGRDPKQDFMRFGRDTKQDFMRFGRDPKQDFMRFGRDPKQDFMRFGRDPKQDFMRFGRDPKQDLMRFFRPHSIKMRRQSEKNFMRFGRPDNFMRFGRAPPPDTTTGDLANFMRFGKMDQSFMRFGQSAPEGAAATANRTQSLLQKSDVKEAAKLLHQTEKNTDSESNPMDKAIKVLYNKHHQRQQQQDQRDDGTEPELELDYPLTMPN